MSDTNLPSRKFKAISLFANSDSVTAAERNAVESIKTHQQHTHSSLVKLRDGRQLNVPIDCNESYSSQWPKILLAVDNLLAEDDLTGADEARFAAEVRSERIACGC